jgi:hypothetical protein
MTQILIFGGGNARAQNHPVAPYIDSVIDPALDSTRDYPPCPTPYPLTPFLPLLPRILFKEPGN